MINNTHSTDIQILVVEDELILAEDVRANLTGLGYGVPHIAVSGEDAVRKVGEMRPDLVLMDIKLQGEMDGIEAAERIRADFDIPVIYMTAFSDNATLQRVKITEPFGYIIKPVDTRELHVTVEMALYRHRLETRLKESERWLDTTLRSIDDGVIATDDVGRVAFMNTVAEGLTGWKQADAVGRDLTEVFRIVDEATGEGPALGQAEGAENPATRVLLEGVVAGLANHTLLIRKDGARIPVDGSGAPIRDDGGAVTGVVLAFRDIIERVRAEEALRESEEKIREIFNASPDIIIVTDVQGNVIECNQVALDVQGISAREEVIGRNAFDFVAPQDRQRAVQSIARASAQDPIRGVEYTLLAQGGREFPGEISGSTIRDADGQPTAIVTITRDITARKRAEQLLRALNQAALAMAQALTPDEIFTAVGETFKELGFECMILLLDESRTRLITRYITYGGQTLRTAEKLTGLSHRDFTFPAKSVAEYSDVIWKRKTVYISNTIEMLRRASPGPIKRLAGQLVRMLKIPRSIAAPLIVADEVIGVLLVQSDDLVKEDALAIAAFAHQVSAAWRKAQLYERARQEIAERKRAEEGQRKALARALQATRALRELNATLEAKVAARTADIRAEKERSETILRRVGDAIIMADLEMRIQYVNPAFSTLTGYTVEEVLGRHANSVGAMVEPGAVQQSIESALAEGRQWQGEAPSRRKDGRIYDAAIIIAPLRDAEGNLTGYVSSHRDISQQKTLERARNQFMDNVSHQLRTPVTTLQLYAHLMQRTEMSEKSRDYLQTMREEIDWLIQLMLDILEMTALDSGKAVTVWEAVSVPVMIENTITRYTSKAETSNLTMMIKPLPPDLPVVKGDQVRLEQALGEIVENAIIFTSESAQSASGGHVALQVETVEDEGATWVTITVQDTGPGIPPEEQERVFDRFFRGSLAESGHIPGVGLGLSIAREIMRVHGGRVEMESGETGSTFKLWLPSSDPLLARPEE